MDFTSTKLDQEAINRLVKTYEASADKLLKDFDGATDFSRARRAALLREVDNELKRLGVLTQRWIDTEIPAAYKGGMKGALDGLEETLGFKPFYHGVGGNVTNRGTDLFGKGFYVSESKDIARKFGKVQKVYLNIFDPNEVLRIDSQDQLEKLIKAAIKKYPSMDPQIGIPELARSQGYKAILGTSNLDTLAGISVLDKSYVSNRPFMPVKGMFTLPNKRAVAALIDDTSRAFGDSLTLLGRNVKSITNQAFQREVRAKIAEGVVTGDRRKEIVDSVKQALHERGMTGLVDRGGRSWSIDRYADMLARTKLTEARNTGLANKMLENKQDLVQVSINRSEHQACAFWEGKVLSLSGKTTGFQTLDLATARGLFHPNCRHTINPIRPDLAAMTYGWDVNERKYRQGVVKDSQLADAPGGKRPANEIQKEIEKARNAGDEAKARDLIKQLPKDLQAGMGMDAKKTKRHLEMDPKTGVVRIVGE